MPNSIEYLKDFFSLINYYRMFIRGYVVTISPLTSVLRKGEFKWDKFAK